MSEKRPRRYLTPNIVGSPPLFTAGRSFIAQYSSGRRTEYHCRMMGGTKHLPGLNGNITMWYRSFITTHDVAGLKLVSLSQLRVINEANRLGQLFDVVMNVQVLILKALKHTSNFISYFMTRMGCMTCAVLEDQ